MDIFIMWMGPIGAICIGIMVLTVFFKIIGYLGDRVSPVKHIKIKKLLSQSELVTAHLTSGDEIPNLKFIGFTDTGSVKGVPYELTNLVTFEKPDGTTVLVRANRITMIEGQKQNISEPATAPYSEPATRSPQG
jgi:hypothetical protein